MKTPERQLQWGPHNVELIPCTETRGLAELSARYGALKAAIEKVEECKHKVGKLRGQLPRASQQIQTAPGISSMTKRDEHYAFAVARTAFAVSLLGLAAPRKALAQFLKENLVQIRPDGRPLGEDDPPTNLWMLKDVQKETPYEVQVLARHNIAAASCLLYELIEKVKDYRRYLDELPDYCEQLYISYRAHQERFNHPAIWEAMLNVEE